MKYVTLLAAQALAVTSQDWNCLGFSNDPQVAPTGDIHVITERIVSLLAIRLVAVLSPPLENFQDFSTTTISRTLLHNTSCWPKTLTEEVIEELRVYVLRIVKLYNETPYHNREHAYHVLLSTNKLLDLLLNVDSENRGQRQHAFTKTYGLRRDTLAQFTMLFAALIHDCQHQGISNRQLDVEGDPLSLVYNDTSVAEQQSLTIAFAELLQPEFAKLRKLLFPSRDIYTIFRKDTVNLVLATDIANPERMQLTKDKWKTAFGDMERNNDVRRDSGITEITLPQDNRGPKSRRQSVSSLFSELSLELDGSIDEYLDLDSSLKEEVEDEDLKVYGMKPRSGSFEEAAGSEEPDAANLGYAPHYLDKSTYSVSTPTTDGRSRSNRRGSIAILGNSGRASRNSLSGRRASIAIGESPIKRMQRRLSTAVDGQQNMKFRQHVGIRRAVDLGGETIENFTRRPSTPACSLSEAPYKSAETELAQLLEEYDEPDGLRAAVVMETILLACDVAHNLQGWDHMLKWSQKLYWELYDANKAGRGFDPAPGWVPGQTGFLMGYMLPLAKKVENMGVFSKYVIPPFAANVEKTNELWEIHGEDVAELVLGNRDIDILAIRSKDRLLSPKADEQGKE